SGCEITPLLREGEEAVAAARQDIIDGWAQQEEQLPNRVLAELRTLVRTDPYNQPFAYSVLYLHVMKGEIAGATRLLDALETELDELGVGLSSDIEQLRDSMGSGDGPGLDADRPSSPSPVIRSTRIEALADDRIAGRGDMHRQIIAAAEAGNRGVVLYGKGGIGKSRLAAEVATQLGKSGYHTAYVVADEHAFGSLQPFLDAFRQLGETIRPYLQDLHEMETQARCREAVIDFVETRFADHPLCLVVDDVHSLDEQSRALLFSLCRAELGIDIFVVATGRAKEPTARWSSWLDEMGRLRFPSFNVQALDQEAILDMISSRFADVERIQAMALAQRLMELSAGIPQVVTWLLERVDEETLEFDAGDVDGTGFSAIVSTLDEQARNFWAIAATLGRQSSVGDVNTLTDDDEDETDRQIQALVDRGLVVELPMPGQYRFLHVLAAEAFRQELGTQEELSLHAEAFGLFTDPIRRAWHAERAVPLVSEAAAARALVEAARLHFSEGNHHDAIAGIRRATELDRTAVELDDRVFYLAALEHTGIRATAERRRVVVEAIENGDLSTALAAATTGLPDAEAFEGDPDRIAVLEMIDGEQLSTDERVWLHTQLSRQMLLAGQADGAKTQADEAKAAAQTADQKAAAWLGVRAVEGLGLQSGPAPDGNWLDRIESEELKLRVRQAGVVNAIAAGESHRGFADIEDHAGRASASGLPKLEWFSQVFLATALTDQGRYPEATEAADRAHRLGLRTGLRVAAGTFETQHFVWLYHRRSHGDLYQHIAGGGPADITANIIYDAASTAVRFAHSETHGDDDQRRHALQSVRMICNDAESSWFDVSAIGLIAELIAATGDSDLMAWARQRLLPRQGMFLLVASAAANLGPCNGVLARLHDDRASRVDLLEEAKREADEHELALWQVATRADLAAAVGDDDRRSVRLRKEADELATTKWLAQVLRSRTGEGP
ncbi:MAG: AAA family ATPase, partial [Acidimicrobiales bacterium]